jgi:hypothetical protein
MITNQMWITLINFDEWTSDVVLFPALQGGLAVFTLFALLRNRYAVMKAGRGEITLQITRGETSMGLLYGTYAALNSLLVALCLTCDVIKNHRVFWSIADTILVAYVCLFNAWFRNQIVGLASSASKLEKR